MIALILGQRNGDWVFAFADKLVVVVASLVGEDHSCALHRDAFAIPDHVDRRGRNAIEFGERALDGSSVDVRSIHFPTSVDAGMDHGNDHDHNDGEGPHIGHPARKGG
jgi:hypothetical protein